MQDKNISIHIVGQEGKELSVTIRGEGELLAAGLLEAVRGIQLFGNAVMCAAIIFAEENGISIPSMLQDHAVKQALYRIKTKTN